MWDYECRGIINGSRTPEPEIKLSCIKIVGNEAKTGG